MNKQVVTSDDSSEEEDTIQIGTNLSYLPIQCPDTECLQIVFQSDLLEHYLNYHAQNIIHDICIAYDSERTIMKIDTRKIPLGCTMYYGALTYAGNKKTDSESQNVSKPNWCLPNRLPSKCGFDNLRHQLPVMVMLTHTSWLAFCKNKIQRKTLEQKLKDFQHLFVIWCFSTDTTKEINATLTVFDRLMMKSYSTISTVHKCPNSFDVDEFTTNSTNCLRLTMGNIKSLLQSDDNGVLLEIILQEKLPIKK